jgi:heme/copper-type cytochrome/quinol oxidase subunit 1
MMRFSPVDLLRGLMKVLRNRNHTPSTPDLISRGALIAVPAAVVVWILLGNIRIASPTTLLTALALLAGGFLTSFTHISTLRLKLSERREEHELDEQGTRDLVDEVATLLLVATVLAVLTAVGLVVAMNATIQTYLCGVPAAIVGAMAAEVVTLFLLTVPRLYNAYLDINTVRTELNGADRRSGNAFRR